MDVNSSDLGAVSIEERSISAVVESIEFIVSSSDFSFDDFGFLSFCSIGSLLGHECLVLLGLLLKFTKLILIEVGIVITIGEFAYLFLQSSWSDHEIIVIEVVSTMVMFLGGDVVHVFTLDLDPFVDSIKWAAIEMSFSSIIIVVDTFPWVESSLGIGNLCIFLGFSGNSGIDVFSNFLVDNSSLSGSTNFTVFLFSFIKGVIIILASFGSTLHHLNLSYWEISHGHCVFKIINVSLSHDLSN